MSQNGIQDSPKAKAVYAILRAEQKVEAAQPAGPAPSIDELLEQGLRNIQAVMSAISIQVGKGIPTRESVQNLKDLMAMLKDLKQQEQDLLDGLDDEQLEKIAKGGA